MKVLFVAAEGLPFSKTGGLADVIEALPKALVAKGHGVAVVLPRYRGTECKKIVLRGLRCRLARRCVFQRLPKGRNCTACSIFSWTIRNISTATQIYGEDGKDYPDNAERSANSAARRWN